MKKLIVLMGLFVAGFSFANAQAQKSEINATRQKSNDDLKEKGAAFLAEQEKRVAELNEVVGLNDGQQKKIADINKQQNEKLRAIYVKYNNEESKDSKALGKEEMRKINAERKDMIKSVLTKEQQEKWSAYEATKKAEKADDHSGHNHK